MTSASVILLFRLAACVPSRGSEAVGRQQFDSAQSCLSCSKHMQPSLTGIMRTVHLHAQDKDGPPILGLKFRRTFSAFKF